MAEHTHQPVANARTEPRVDHPTPDQKSYHDQQDKPFAETSIGDFGLQYPGQNSDDQGNN